MSLENEIALVTGGATGIGRATAVALARRGARVAINVRDDVAEATDVLDEIRALGGVATAIVADVSDSNAVDTLFAEAERQYGAPTILVSNAGALRPFQILETSDEDWRMMLATNLDGAFYCARRAVPAMRARKAGRLIFIGSIAGQQGSMAGHVAYAASKGGIGGLAKTLAITEAPHGITSNVVAPGVILTPLLQANHAAGAIDGFGAGIPLGLGKPEDVAGAVVYLAGPEGRYANGATIDVNGGQYRR